jgi:hypothetical protein
LTAKTSPPERRRKSIQQVVHYALAHKIRVHILLVLHEGIYTAAEIAARIDEPLNNAANHIRHLLDDGSIEIAKEEQTGNITKYWYRAVEIPYCSKEEAEAMPWEHRQMHAGFVVQSAHAEALAALWAGKLADPRTWLYWNWHHMDERGREDLEAEQQRYVERVLEIEIESTNRAAESGEETASMLVTQFSYERARHADGARPS